MPTNREQRQSKVNELFKALFLDDLYSIYTREQWEKTQKLTEMGSICLRCLVSLALLSLLGLGAMGTNSTTVHFINGMPNSKPIWVHCKLSGTVQYFEHFLQLGEDYQWKPKPNQTFYYTAVWELYFGNRAGYEPDRDHVYPNVYVNIHRTGFYLHHDHVHYKLLVEWEIEKQ